MFPQELQNIVNIYGGYLCVDEGQYYIRIDTFDSTSEENYDELLSIIPDIEEELEEYQISEYWADHDTQIIEFKKGE